MRKTIIVISSLLLLLAAGWGLASAKKSAAESPFSVLIVKQGLHSRDGAAQTLALSVTNLKTILALENLFPNYRKSPSSSMAGGWEAGYRVYFNFPKGRTLCVTVSQNDAGKTWSMGDGDFATRGDFEKLVEQLENKVQKLDR